MIHQLQFAGYSPIGDLTAVAVCFVMLILIYFSYTNKTSSFRVFLSLIGLDHRRAAVRRGIGGRNVFFLE